MPIDNTARPSDIKCSRQYWTYDLRGATSLKAERNLSQLAEWDDRLTPAARKVLDFLIDWEHDEHGDSLASLRHITVHLNARAPEGCKIAKRTVEGGIACLLGSGWIVRAHKGTDQKNASRYVISADILTNAGLGQMPTVRDTPDGSGNLTVPDVAAANRAIFFPSPVYEIGSSPQHKGRAVKYDAADVEAWILSRRRTSTWSAARDDEPATQAA